VQLKLWGNLYLNTSDIAGKGGLDIGANDGLFHNCSIARWSRPGNRPQFEEQERTWHETVRISADCIDWLGGLSWAAGHQLGTIFMGNAGSFSCTETGTTKTATYRNATGGNLYIGGWHIWVGETFNGVSDTAFSLIDLNNGTVLEETNWDHYANPTCATCNNDDKDLGWNYYTLVNGDSIEISLTCPGPHTSTPASAGGEAWLRFSSTTN